ncbi:hopanoid biosynthesis associated radical SAM protein HpnJ, partial [Burkholderia pseudomallei]
GRGCRSKCTFCLWPQKVGGHRNRVRSVESVLAEVKWIRDNMPVVKEIMFDDDTFTDFKPRCEENARGLGKLGVTWSC